MNKSKRFRTTFGHSSQLEVEILEARTLLSATPVETDITLNPAVLGSIAEQATVPAQYVAKVEQSYWQVAEQVAQASQQGALSGQALQNALANLELSNPSLAPVDAEGQIRSVITATDTTAATIEQLEAAGVQLDAGQLASGGSALASNRFYAWVPAHLADDVASLEIVKNVSFPVNAIADVGAETTEGDVDLLAADVREQFGFNGAGVKVGVISTGVPGLSTSQASGDLPATVAIDPNHQGRQTHDEGTAMLEIVHDLAPGAELYFSGFISLGFDQFNQEIFQFTTDDMVDAIEWMVSQGVDVIVDDLQFFSEPAFTDGIVADAAADAVAAGVTFVTAAGNRADRHYQGMFIDSGSGFHDFKLGAGTDQILNVLVAPNETVAAWLHWSDPLGTSSNNYDIAFFDFSTQTFIGTPGLDIQDGVGGDDDPIERAEWTNTSGSVVEVGVVVQRVSGAGRELEIYITPNGLANDDDATISDSMFGHKAVEDVISVGAIDTEDTGLDDVEAYSSRGPTTIYTDFSTQTPTQRNSLDGAAVDGVVTTVPGYTDFHGTSAAAPHVAAIAALMLDANPNLTPSQISSILASTAIDIDAPGYDVNSGAGRFDALAAVNAALPPDYVNPPGDYNRNGSVSIGDYTVWRDNYGATVALYALGDGNGDGVINASDYFVWKQNFGETAATFDPALFVLPGDFNEDGTVNQADRAIWNDTQGSTTELGADHNGNGVVDLTDLQMWQEMHGVTTLDIILGDFNDDKIVDTQDYDLWAADDPAADADGDGIVAGDMDDYNLWAANFGTYAAELLPVITQGKNDYALEVPLAAPTVVEVTLSKGGSNGFDFSGVDGSGEQLRTVPVGGLDTLAIKFSEEVFVLENALSLSSIQGAVPPNVANFEYNVPNQTATWTLASPLDAGQYTIELDDSIIDLDREKLDGEFYSPWELTETVGSSSTLPSGDGAAGGNFEFRFTHLPGDFNRDNVVDAADQAIHTGNVGAIASGATHADGDADGDGAVTAADGTILSSNLNLDYTQWNIPNVILVSTLIDENDADHSLGDLSLREALAIAAGQAGTDDIVFHYNLHGGTITLAGSQLVVDSDVNIVGPAKDLLAVSGNDTSRVFKVLAGTTVSLSGMTIQDGYVSDDGGGIWAEGDLTVDRVDFLNNQTVGFHHGGAIHSGAGDLTIRYSTFDGNEAVSGAGIYRRTKSGEHATIFSSLFHDNLARGSGLGGGIAFYGYSSVGTADIVNSTFTDNRADIGSAIATFGKPELTIVNSTIVYGTVTNNAYQIVNLADAASITIHNSIVAGGSGGPGYAYDVYGAIDASSSNNIFGSVRNNTALKNAGNNNLFDVAIGQIGLADLGDYGGPTQAHALLDDSLAIDAGDNAIAQAYGLLFDQRGEWRITDGDDDGVATVDIGAFELAADEYFGSLGA